MSRVLLLGHAPPPLLRDASVEASHYRTWQFLEGLLSGDRELCLCFDDRDSAHPGWEATPAHWGERVQLHPIPFAHRWGWVRQLQQIHDRFQPDCVVAVNFDCCVAATRLQTSRPLWMDLYGDQLTIQQAACHRTNSNRGITTVTDFLRSVLEAGDVFSTCGTPQRHMVTGELAMAGRLNAATFGYEFTRVVLPGAHASWGAATDVAGDRNSLTALGLSHEAFAVLWCGGYNTWTDVETLFRGLEMAMAKNPQLHYVSVGANTYDAVDNVYTRFLALRDQSEYRERFHMLGWRPWKEIPRYYRDCDVGLNIDAPHYETLYGTRTRLLEMMGAGLPVVATRGCELSQLIADREAGLQFEPGDAAGLDRQLRQLAENPDLRRDMAARAADFARGDLSFVTTTEPVRRWVAEPTSAPDKHPLRLPERLRRLEYRSRARLRKFIWRVAALER